MTKNTMIFNNTIILRFTQTVNEALETHLKQDDGTGICSLGKENIHICDTNKIEETRMDTSAQKDKKLISTKVSVKSKTT